jgi:hypothetical protein
MGFQTLRREGGQESLGNDTTATNARLVRQ